MQTSSKLLLIRKRDICLSRADSGLQPLQGLNQSCLWRPNLAEVAPEEACHNFDATVTNRW